MYKYLKKWLLIWTKKEVKDFLETFSEGDVEENGMVVGTAALLHYHFEILDPNFKILINSKSGENISIIARYNISRIDQLHKEYIRSNKLLYSAATRLWSTTFRCMLDESLNQYGVQIWQIAFRSITSAEDYLKSQLELMRTIDHTNNQNKKNIENAIRLCSFIPPQFIK